MLTTLRIRNLALVPEVTLELPAGLVAITGETGAGKSIILGALDLVLGDRADRSLVRTGEESCSVEAVFDVASLGSAFHRLLEEHGLEACSDGQLILRRTFTSAGSNRQFVNGTPTTLQTLARVGDWLVDLHGPHEHQSLLHPAHQLALLDACGNLGGRVAAVEALVRERGALQQQLADLIVDERTYAQQLDLLRHQVREITGAQLSPDEDQTVSSAYLRASNAARRLELGQATLNALAEADGSILSQAGAVGRLLQDLAHLDPDAQPFLEAFAQGIESLRELQRQMSRYADRIDLDPEHLRTLEERLNLIQSLKRKYGPSLDEVAQFAKTAAQRLAALEQRDAEVTRLNAESERVTGDLWHAASDLSARRRETAAKLARAVTAQLVDLGFRQCEFGVHLTSLARTSQPEPQPGRTGIDSVEFQFAPNPGEPAKPLRAIASSGELARAMLAIKTVLAVEDQIPVLIFDEVDANVGGETANAVGEKMRVIAQRRQVLCITHLPQVAALADAHFVVTKQIAGGRTQSAIERLDRAGRVTELARMLGGQSQAARHHAVELLRGSASPHSRASKVDGPG